MHTIDGNNITLTRGDSLSIQLELTTSDGAIYTPAEGSSIRFAMKERYTDSDDAVKLVKNIPINTLVLEIEPEDTKELKMRKKYVYDIQLTDETGRVDTFIKGIFLIDNEVI